MYDVFRCLSWPRTCSIRQLVLITDIHGLRHNTPEVRFNILIGYSNLPLDFCCEAIVIAADIRRFPGACIFCNRSSPSATNARNVRDSLCVIYSGNNVTICMYKPLQLSYWSTISREVRGGPSLCHVGSSSGWMHLGRQQLLSVSESRHPSHSDIDIILDCFSVIMDSLLFIFI